MLTSTKGESKCLPLITKYTSLYMTTLCSLPIHKKECTCVRYHYRWALALQALGKRKIICGRRGTWESADSSLKDSHSDLSNTYCEGPTVHIYMLSFNLSHSQPLNVNVYLLLYMKAHKTAQVEKLHILLASDLFLLK